jgi:hypothetical protein
MVLLEVLFVRHGLSCANVWSSLFKPTAMMYADPELTRYGIDLCVERKPALEAAIHAKFGDDRYAIGSSCMIRAQMTAYHQLASDKDKRIHILPHIAELGNTYSGTPLSSAQQAPILGSAIVAKLGTDARGDVSNTAKSNWSLFLDWANHLGEHTEPFFTRVEHDGEPVYRAVLFTHSHFLEHALGIFPQNNDVIYAKIDTASKAILTRTPMTSFPRITDPRGRSLDGCRFQTSYQTVTGTPKRSRKAGGRRNYARKSHKHRK